MKCCVLTALAAVLLCTTAVARAESGDEAEITAMAKEHYKLGLDAYKAAKYPEAIKELKKAYLLKRLPALLLNIGATYRKMHDLDNAVYYYKKYLAEAPDARDRGEVEKTLAEVEKERPAGSTPVPNPAPSEGAAEAAPPAQEWKHTPVDAAPPDQPIDVRVSMPVTKGVKVYVYYRSAGDPEFNKVLMRRHGNEKVGRIPGSAISGKSVQYYVEGKDDKGNVVKTFGSPSDPNVIMVDPKAAPQMVASAGDDKPEKAKGAVRDDLDDEAAPITGELEEKQNRARKHSTSSGGERTARFGTLFYVGLAAAVAGAGAVGGGAYGLYQAKSYSDVLTADSNFRDQNGNPYRFTDPSAMPYDDKYIEQRGKFFDTLGIALTVSGAVLLAAGVTMIALDQTVLKNRSEKPKRSSSAWLAPSVAPGSGGGMTASMAGGFTF
ncbi:MAG: TonB-dependent receptor [Myxococcales bacterium]|nr:TonB-dependent receptor [Myxococcales bacterium]